MNILFTAWVLALADVAAAAVPRVHSVQEDFPEVATITLAWARPEVSNESDRAGAKPRLISLLAEGDRFDRDRFVFKLNGVDLAPLVLASDASSPLEVETHKPAAHVELLIHEVGKTEPVYALTAELAAQPVHLVALPEAEEIEGNGGPRIFRQDEVPEELRKLPPATAQARRK